MATIDFNKCSIFKGLEPDEVNLIIGVCDERLMIAGENLFLENESGDSLWIVTSGRVDVFKNIRGDIDRTLISLGVGEVTGEISFIDQSRRSAGVRTIMPSEFLVLSRTAFQEVQQNHPKIAAAFFQNLSSILAGRMRITTELYRESVAFSIEATGASQLNLRALSEDLRPVSLYLSNGLTLSGFILQMDNTPAGYTIIVKDKSGKLAIIPYHAIQKIELE